MKRLNYPKQHDIFILFVAIVFFFWVYGNEPSLEVSAQAVTNTPTSTPTSTPTLTPTSTATPTTTPTLTPTSTPTATSTPTLTPTICAPDAYEPDDSAAQAGLAPIGGPLQSHNFHQPGDVDWIRFDAIAGRYYEVWTENLVGSDTILYLIDVDGQTILAQNDDDPGHGLASRINWKASTTGTYYVRVEEYNLLGNCVSYDLGAMIIPDIFLPLVLHTYHNPVTQLTPTPTVTPTITPTPSPTVPPPCLPGWLANIPLPDAPKGLAISGDRLYTGLYNSASLGVINTDTATYLRTSPSIGQGANGVAVSQGKVYMANRDSATLSIYTASDPQTYLGALPTGPLPFGVAANGNRVFVANFGDDSVSIIDSLSDHILTKTAVGSQPTLPVAIPGGVVVPLFNGNTASGVRFLDNDGNNLGFVATGIGPFAATYDATTNRIYVSHWGDHRIVILDATTHAILDEFSAPRRPYVLAINPTTQHLFIVGAEDDDVYVYAMPAKQHLATLAMQTIGVEHGGQGIAVQDNKIYVAIYASQHISILNDTPCPP
ncbi:MAG: hypothetical protein GXP38_04125 [Chloroflexi bacterium]|nr:hypothetical protein [Chloroflexota bacterium]